MTGTKLRRAALGTMLMGVLALAGCGAGRASGEGPGGGDAATPGDAASGTLTAEENTRAAAILQRTCTVCHGLSALDVYATYYGVEEWGGIIETMMGYGAQISYDEATLLARYLAFTYKR